MSKKIPASTWAPLDFSKVTRELVALKFQALHCFKHGRNPIHIDVDDLTSKFDKLNLKYEVKRGSTRTK